MRGGVNCLVGGVACLHGGTPILMQSVALSFIEGGSNLTSLCSQALIKKSGYTRLQSDRLPPCSYQHNHHTYLIPTLSSMFWTSDGQSGNMRL